MADSTDKILRNLMNKFSIPEDLTLEACTDSLKASIDAEEAGAHRIELCADLHLDGLTPDIDLVKDTCSQLDIPVKVMIRSRPGNFRFSDAEINEMTELIKQYNSLNIDSYVVGALNENNMPDLYALEQWAVAAGENHLCFHKAIDRVPDWRRALDMISDIKSVNAILTSGQQDKARNGLDNLEKMVQNYGDRFEIIAAGGIAYNDIPFFMKKWSGRSLHGRRIMDSVPS